MLSIVIPAYAEARFLGATLRALRAFLGDRAGATEVIVVTADAPDGTPELAARELMARTGKDSVFISAAGPPTIP